MMIVKFTRNHFRKSNHIINETVTDSATLILRKIMTNIFTYLALVIQISQHQQPAYSAAKILKWCQASEPNKRREKRKQQYENVKTKRNRLHLNKGLFKSNGQKLILIKGKVKINTNYLQHKKINRVERERAKEKKTNILSLNNTTIKSINVHLQASQQFLEVLSRQAHE